MFSKKLRTLNLLVFFGSKRCGLPVALSFINKVL